MKKIVSTCLLLFLFSVIKGQTFTLKGKIKDNESKSIYLNYRTHNGDYLGDSTIILNGKFEFSGFISEPTKALLTTSTKKYIKANDTDYVFIFIEPNKMEIYFPENKLKQAKLTGSKTQNELLKLNKKQEDPAKMIGSLMKGYDQLNNLYILKKKQGGMEDTLEKISNSMDSIRKLMKPYNDQLFVINKEFYEKYPTSFVTLYSLKSSGKDFSFKELQNYYNKMSKSVQQSQTGMELKNQIDKLNTTLAGRIAPNFSAKDLAGNILALTDLRGKYVLIDFWATFCKPCRAEAPELINLYNKYKDKGIEFIGVADDDNRLEKWKAAIEKDGIGIWKQVLRGHQNDKIDINELYNIQILPTKILIDPKGIIIARYSDESDNNEALHKLLEQIFNY